MEHRRGLILGSFAVFAVIFLIGGTKPADAAVKNWQKGMIVIPQTTQDFGSSEMNLSLKNLASTGVDHVSLVVPYYQDNGTTSVMHPGSDTPTDSALVTAIQESHALGMQVEIRIYMNATGVDWRARITPSDRDAWFKSYTDVLSHYAQLGEQNHVEVFCLGAEMINVTRDDVNPTNTAHWLAMIANIRKVFSGKLTYYAESTNGTVADPSSWWDEKDAVGFWPALDYVGSTEYPSLNGSSPDTLAQSWQTVAAAEQEVALARKYNKPFIFGEIGYINTASSTDQPWNWFKEAEPSDEAAQAQAYDAFLKFWDQFPEIGGVYFWNWNPNPAQGGGSDVGFSPQGKQAQNVLAKWFGGTQQTVGAPQAITFPFRLNAGGVGYSDGANTWNADAYSTGGTAYVNSVPISGTTNPKVYQSERWGDFAYDFPSIPNGKYKVTLKFAEIYWTQSGQRLFNVDINGQPVLQNFDIVADAGGPNIADDKTFDVDVTAGSLRISFNRVKDFAKISGIEIVPSNSSPGANPVQNPATPASQFAVYGTGVNNDNTPAAPGAADPHYTLTTSPDSAYPGPTAYVASLIPGRSWMPNTSVSQWVAPGSNAQQSYAGGDYTYHTTFDLTGFDPNTAVLSGQFAADNEGIIKLNGMTVGSHADDFGSFTLFQIDKGFVPGKNSLDFVIKNWECSCTDPTGLRVEIKGFANPIPAQTPPQNQTPPVVIPPVITPPVVTPPVITPPAVNPPIVIPVPPTPPASASGGNFSAEVTAPQLAANTPAAVNVKITGSADSTNVITDFEIYDQNNKQVFQKWFENENFAAGIPNSFDFAWVPPSSGTFVLKGGIFSSTWAQNYFWDNRTQVMILADKNAPPPPSVLPPPIIQPPAITPPPIQGTPAAVVINNWWPTNAATISGVQPLKANIDSLDVSKYDMYWQVDGNSLNLMSDSNVDWPHKESQVDVSGWNWNSDNQYQFGFIAKDKSGATIGTKTITVTVMH